MKIDSIVLSDAIDSLSFAPVPEPFVVVARSS